MISRCLVSSPLLLALAFHGARSHWCDTEVSQRETIRTSVASALSSQGYSTKHGLHRCVGESGGAGAGNPESNSCFFEFPQFPFSKTFLNKTFQIHHTSDVLVYVGCAPAKPGPLYFGFTPYLAGFNALSAVKQKPFGQMVDSLNQLVMNSTGPAGEPWGSTFGLVLTADSISDADARAALVAAGLPPTAINTVVVPYQLLSLGRGLFHNFFVLGARAGPFADAAQRDAHLLHSTEPFFYFRAAHRSAKADPFPTPRRRNRTAAGISEFGLESNFSRLLQSVKAWAGAEGWEVADVVPLSPMLRDGVYSNGTECITNRSTTGCSADTDDAAYMITGHLEPLLPDGLDIILGTNQARTGMAVYSSAAVYTVPVGGGQAHTLGGAAIDIAKYDGSAQRYISEADPMNVSSFFAIDVGYGTCDTDARWCINATVVDQAHNVTYVTRAYLNPETGTGPDPDQLLRPTVVRLRPSAALVV